MTNTLLLTNGRIHTMNPAQVLASAVAVRDGRILAVGGDELLELRGPGVEWIDLGGRGVTPGLVDAHVHFQHFALSLQNVDLDGSPSRAKALERVAAFAAGRRGGAGWLQGRGWSQDAWPDRAFPSATDLDAIVADRPVYLAHKSGHAAWVNSHALRLARVDETTGDPSGGQIQRDAAGRPTGILFEEAMSLVSDTIPRRTPAEIADAMREAQAYCWSVGLTGIHDFDGRDCFLALQTLREGGELGLRVVKNVPVYRLEHALGIGLRSGFGDDWLRIGGVKIFADGALGSRTAAMIAPYEGEPENRGIVVTDKEEMLEKARQASAGGLSLTIHAIGDRANHDVLDVYELLRREESERGAPRLRHRIEHVQLLHPNDLNRLAELNVIASMQPIHATSDMDMADRYWGERARYSYAWRTMWDNGALVVFGSDAPVERIDPLPGLHAAVTRRRADGRPGPDGWYPEQRLQLWQAVYAFTTAAAITSGQSVTQGMIAPGKLADLTVFDRDPFAVPTNELLETQVAATIVGGDFHYRQL
jgi:predicted amidohydrolase YtcJ